MGGEYDSGRGVGSLFSIEDALWLREFRRYDARPLKPPVLSRGGALKGP